MPFSSSQSLHFSTASLGLLLAFAVGAPPALACSECGCLLSSDWSAQGYPELSGVTASGRFEYSDSTNLRSGDHSVDRPAPETTAEQEIQHETLTRTTWFGLDFVGSDGWAIAGQIPWRSRYHSTVAEGYTALSESRASGPGDLQVIARHLTRSMNRSLGFQLGLRLPTGSFGQTFATGPQAGLGLDRGLQLGSGTTDLLLGASYFRRASQHVGWFTQFTADQPLAPRDGFLPSTTLAANAGIRYLNSTSATPQLQLNARWDAREHGPNADTANSGGARVYLSPGCTFELGRRTSAFAFVQLPVFRRLNGYQLEPRATMMVGLTWRL